MTNEELSLKCASVLGWPEHSELKSLYVPHHNDRSVYRERLHESPAAVLAMICELGRRGVGIEPLGDEQYGWAAVRLTLEPVRSVRLSDHPTPEAAFVRCVMEAICEVMA